MTEANETEPMVTVEFFEHADTEPTEAQVAGILVGAQPGILIEPVLGEDGQVKFDAVLSQLSIDESIAIFDALLRAAQQISGEESE